MNITLVPDAFLPTRAHPHDAGLDLRAATMASIYPGGRLTIPTGVSVAIPEGHAGLVCSRSGLASKHGVSVLNAPGIIDHGYTGDVGVILHNGGHQTFHVNPGDRIAQLVVVPIMQPEVVVVDSLDDTARGDGGFGSTGK